MLATAAFFGMIALLGGPSARDSSESSFATWATAHGQLACAYAPATPVTQTFLPQYQVGPQTAPLWPLVSGGIASLTKLGHDVPFPSIHQLGVRCDDAYTAIYGWAEASRALLPTTGIGYAAWFALVAGVVAVLRAIGRGGTRWEALGVLLVGLTPAVWMPVLDYYHPEDLLAVGLMLGGLACFARRNWGWSGLLLGLAVTSQQFALLALVPLVVAAPARARWRLLVAAGAAWALVSLPVVAATSGRALGAVVFGTGNAATFGGTLLWETGVRGNALTFFSRIVPIILAAVIAWWVVRRVGPRVLQPVPLVSLVATCVSLRLVFEKGLFDYKFMALAVMLIVLAITQRRITGRLVVWLALVPLAFNPVPTGLAVNARSWGFDATSGFEVACILAGLLLVAWDASRRRVRWYLVAGVVLALCAFVHRPPMIDSVRAPFAVWFWQLVLVGSGVVMAAGPLVSLVRARERGEERSPAGAELVGLRYGSRRRQGLGVSTVR